MRKRPLLWTIVTAVIIVAMTGVTFWTVTALPFYDHKHGAPLLIATGILWALFALAAIALRGVSVKPAIALILIGSALIGGAAMAGPPNTSTDSARYAWDGIVQDAGISPYQYVPVADELAPLRPYWLFPDAVPNADGTHHCELPRTHTTSTIPSKEIICTALNRSKVPTIYPPTSEIFFAAVRVITGPDAQYWPLQLTGLIMSLGISVLLIRAMLRRGINPRWAALWALSPLVATEAITNSHVDVLGALLVVAASLLVSRGMRFRGGIALGAAIAAKLIPVIAAPALLRKQPWKVIVAAVVTFAALYIPYVVTTGIGVLGYLPGYLNEEGYNSGTRFVLLSLLVPKSAALIVAAVLIAITAVIVWRKTDPASPWLGQLVMIGTTLLIVSPRYPWYALLLVPFIALTGRWEWSLVPLALTTRLLIPSVHTSRIAISVAIVVIVAMAIWRHIRRRAEDNRAEAQSISASGTNHLTS
ncbi:hypothetical protein BH09ACT1_BH09ACT1_17390 [soil metagenome]